MEIKRELKKIKDVVDEDDDVMVVFLFSPLFTCCSFLLFGVGGGSGFLGEGLLCLTLQLPLPLTNFAPLRRMEVPLGPPS